MTYKPLDSLPAETLINITSYLDPAPLPDLTSFALSSKACYAAAACHLFRSIEIRLTDPRKLRDDVDKWLGILDRANSARHVRHLTVCFDVKSEATLTDRMWNERLRGCGLDPHETGLVPGWRRKSLRREFETPAAWDPLMKILVALGGLSRLVIDYELSLCRHLAGTLSQHHPSCRLDLRRVARNRVDEEIIPDLQDLALLASPQLDSITFADYHLAQRRSHPPNTESFKFELAAYKFVAGLAPSLKSVNFDQVPAAREKPDSWKHETVVPEPSHEGCAVDAPKPASLTSLSIDTPSWMRLEAWSRVTDFSTLRRLRLCANEEELSWLAQNVKLPSLSDLEISRLNARHETVEAFMDTLPPLASLSLMSKIGPATFCLALATVGGSLRRLIVVPSPEYVQNVFDPRLVNVLPQACPLLEDLFLTIPYPMGESIWTTICESLGRIRRLRTVCLTLAVGTDHVERDAWEDFVRSTWDAVRGQGSRLETMLIDFRNRRSGVPYKGYQVRRLGSGDCERILIQRIPPRLRRYDSL